MATIGLASPEPGGRRAAKQKRRRELIRSLDYSVIGLVFPVAMALGFLAGRWVGGWFDAPTGGALLGGLLGVVAGFYNVFKISQKLSRDDQSRGS